MTDHNFYLHDAVHILRSNGTTEHADACEWAASELESLRASLTRVEEERDARPTIEEWSNEIDRVRDHWKGKLTAQAQDVLSVINPILQGPAGVELSSAQCEQLVLLEDRLSRDNLKED